MRTVAEKLLTYALGRGLTYRDAPTVRQLVRDLADEDYRWSALIQGVVHSAPFQMRRGPRDTDQPATAEAQDQ